MLPMGGSACVNIMSGSMSPSTTPHAPVSAASLYLTPVWDLTLPICVVYPFVSLSLMMLLVYASSSLCMWCVYLRGLSA